MKEIRIHLMEVFRIPTEDLKKAAFVRSEFYMTSSNNKKQIGFLSSNLIKNKLEKMGSDASSSTQF